MADDARTGSPALAIGEGLARLIAFGTTFYLSLAGAARATVISVVRLGVAVVAAREAIPGALPLAGFGRVLAAGLGMGLAVVASGTSGSLAAILVGGVAYPLLLVFRAVSFGGQEGIRVRG